MIPPRWRDHLPSLFVVLALVALLVSPALVQRRVDGLRDEIENAGDPARTVITEVQYLLARQTSTLRGYLLTGDRSYLETFGTLANEEREAYERLDPLVSRLGPQVRARFIELRTLSTYWHERVGAQDGLEALDARRTEGPAEALEEELYREALEAAARLDESVLQATRARQERIRSIERESLVVSLGLTLVALAAALTVTWLSGRLRRLAEEAESRRSEAERALAETARAVESRAYLIRGVTHDVKNPLGAADGYAGILEMGLKGELTPAQLEIIVGIRRSIRGALGMVADLLDLSRAEGGGLRLEHEATSVSVLMRDVVHEHVGAAGSVGHGLHLSLPPEPVVIYTDAARVRQILANLVSNALKYTPPPGRISLGVDSAPAGEPGGTIHLWVADTGPGIPAESRDRIFEEFHRLDERGEGHGLGLAISRRLARLLGGDVTVEDAEGGGAKFVLRLPRDLPEAPRTSRVGDGPEKS